MGLLTQTCNRCGRDFLLGTFNSKEICDECLVASIHHFKLHREKMDDYVQVAQGTWIKRNGRSVTECKRVWKEIWDNRQGASERQIFLPSIEVEHELIKRYADNIRRQD